MFREFPTKHTFVLPLACVSALLSNGASAKTSPMPASMEEMWQIIQQQQREIEALKKKVSENAAPLDDRKSASPSSTATATAPTPETTAKESPATQQKTAKTEQERKTDILATEVEKLKTQLNIPDKREYKSMYGMGPAASQVYLIKRGLSIGGYGEYFYSNFLNKEGTNSRDRVDFARLVLYAGYKFNDWIVLNSEIEFEHGKTGKGPSDGGSVSVEFSQLDFFLHPAANIRTGMMLMPMGFINEIHEPLFFHGNRRPDVERFIIPTTWREIGAGLHGEILPGLTYRMYGVNGLRAGVQPNQGFTSAGIRDGRQNGAEAFAEDWAYTGRVDYSPDEVPGLTVGASTWLGNSGQGQVFAGQRPAVFTQLYEGHVEWHYRGLEFRALGAWGGIGDAGLVSEQKKQAVGSSNYGWYVEAAYDLLPWVFPTSTQFLAPFFRFERFNTLATVPRAFQSEANGFWDRTIYQVGLTYKPHPNIVVKADYRNIGVQSGAVPDEFNLGVGFIY